MFSLSGFKEIVGSGVLVGAVCAALEAHSPVVAAGHDRAPGAVEPGQVQAQGLDRDDPQFGTWELDVAKSTFSTGPQVSSQTIRFEYVSPTEIRVTSKGALVDGRTLDNGGVAQTVHLDGKEYQFTAADGQTGTRTDQRLGPGQRVSVRKMTNGATQTTRLSVLPDGNTMTITTRGTTPTGQPIKNDELLHRVVASTPEPPTAGAASAVYRYQSFGRRPARLERPRVHLCSVGRMGQSPRDCAAADIAFKGQVRSTVSDSFHLCGSR